MCHTLLGSYLKALRHYCELIAEVLLIDAGALYELAIFDLEVVMFRITYMLSTSTSIEVEVEEAVHVLRNFILLDKVAVHQTNAKLLLKLTL